MKTVYATKAFALIVVLAIAAPACAEEKGIPVGEPAPTIVTPEKTLSATVSLSEWANKLGTSVKDNGYGLFDLVWNHEEELFAVLWAKRAAALVVAGLTISKVNEYIIAPVVSVVSDIDEEQAKERQEACHKARRNRADIK